MRALARAMSEMLDVRQDSKEDHVVHTDERFVEGGCKRFGSTCTYTETACHAYMREVSFICAYMRVKNNEDGPGPRVNAIPSKSVTLRLASANALRTAPGWRSV